MNKEDKELLLKDLCTRLPYGVKVKVLIEEVEYDAVVHGVYADETVFVEQSPEPNKVHRIDVAHVSEVKPYLFPLSSMTIEQKEEERSLKEESYYSFDANENIYTLQDFYNKNHLDYRGLIPKGLAIDATGLNIY